MGQGQAMPQQGVVQNAQKNAGKPDEDQADLESAKRQEESEEQASKAHKPYNKMDVKKLSRAEKSDLVDQVLKVTLQSRVLGL